MKNPFPSDIRSKLILLGASAFLPVVLLMIFNFAYQRNLDVADANEQMAKILKFAVLHEEEAIRESHRLLATLAEIPEVRRGGNRADGILARFLKNSPEYANFGVARRDGKVVSSALPLKTPVNVSDRLYFRDALGNRAPSVGEYQVGRITGTPVINFGYPLLDRHGAVTAVLFAALDLSRVTKFEAEVTLQTPKDSPYVKLDSKGAVLTSYPEAPMFWKGHRLEKSLFERISREKNGSFRAVGADGVERLHLFSPLRGLLGREGGYALLGIPTPALFAEANRVLAVNLAVLSTVVVLFLAIVRFGGNALIVRPVGALVDAAKRLAGGDLAARSGLAPAEGELGQLGRAFDEMAAELQRRQDDSRKMEESLRDAHQRLAFHIRRMPLGCIVWDKDFRVVEWNPAAEQIFGWKAEEASGKQPFEFIVPVDEKPHVEKVWSKLLEGDDTSYSLNTNVRKDGRSIPCEWFNAPLRDARGNITGVLSMVNDVTEKTHLERQLQTAQRMEAVGTLAGGIAHDFNNSLTGIFGFGELLRSQLAGNESALTNLSEIQRCAERAATLTRQLLTYARRQVIEPVNLSLNSVITNLLKLVSKVVGEHIEIRTFLAKDLPTIRADMGQVEQVILNLVLNARDAMPGGGQVLIETGVVRLDADYIRYHPYMSAGEYAVLTVSDTGTGLDAKTQERVFEPFFTTKGPEKGSGLGLAMVYGIVKQHNGFIHLYSEPGKGTTFRIYFPPVEAAPDVVVPAKPADVRGGAETVLLAEDDESVRMLAERTLKELGYTVLVSRNGAEAIDAFRRNGEGISLALLDVVMPVKGGKEAYEAMHKTKPGLKVIFMSGYTANTVHESFVLIAGVPFLAKPFGPDALARKVREVLDDE